MTEEEEVAFVEAEMVVEEVTLEEVETEEDEGEVEETLEAGVTGEVEVVVVGEGGEWGMPRQWPKHRHKFK